MNITLSGIYVYPVKSLGAVALGTSATAARGLVNDRRFIVVDDKNEFLTQRALPKMATVWVDIDGADLTLSAPDLDSVGVPLAPEPRQGFKVRVWKSIVDAHAVSRDADRFLSEYLGVSCRLAYMPDSSERQVDPEFALADDIVSFADGFPFLLISEGSLADLNTRLAKPLPMNRFRPNLVVQGCEPYAEDDWEEIRIGEATLRAVKACTRCVVTTTDQATGEVDGSEPLRTLATYRYSGRGVTFGQNMVPIGLGKIAIGDTVEVTR